MSQPATDHRRATAERNAAAILDATERLLARRATLSMAAIAAEAGVSRVTLYAHHKSLSDVVGAVAGRAMARSVAAVTSAEPGEGPAAAALERVLAASWHQVAAHEDLARAAAEHLPSGDLHDAHAPLAGPIGALIRRGQREGAFRSDLPAEWLVTLYFALVHAAADHARSHGTKPARALALLQTTVRDTFAPRGTA
jgi:AcrR family transcriptional regulator